MKTIVFSVILGDMNMKKMIDISAGWNFLEKVADRLLFTLLRINLVKTMFFPKQFKVFFFVCELMRDIRRSIAASNRRGPVANDEHKKVNRTAVGGIWTGYLYNYFGISKRLRQAYAPKVTVAVKNGKPVVIHKIERETFSHVFYPLESVPENSYFAYWF